MEKRGLKEKNNQSAGAHASAKDTPPKSLPTPAMMVVAGSIVLGQMDAAAAAAINRAAAPIHLPEGLAGRRGLGLLHVESTPGRVAAISGAGFPNALAFIAYVAKHWTAIVMGEQPHQFICQKVLPVAVASGFCTSKVHQGASLQ